MGKGREKWKNRSANEDTSTESLITERQGSIRSMQSSRFLGRREKAMPSTVALMTTPAIG